MRSAAGYVVGQEVPVPVVLPDEAIGVRDAVVRPASRKERKAFVGQAIQCFHALRLDDDGDTVPDVTDIQGSGPLPVIGVIGKILCRENGKEGCRTNGNKDTVKSETTVQ